MSISGHGTAPSPAVVVGDFALGSGGRIPQHRHPVHQLVWAASGVVSVSAAGGVWVLPATRALWIPAGTDHAIEGGPAVARAVYVARSPRGWRTPTVIAVTPLLRELAIHLAATADPDTARVPGTSRLVTGRTWRERNSPGPAAPNSRSRSDSGRDADGYDGRGRDGGRSTGDGGGFGGEAAATGPTGEAAAAGPAGDAARRRAEAVLLDILEPVSTATIDVTLPSDPRALAVALAIVDDPADGRGISAWGRQVGAGGRTLARLFTAETGMSFGRWRANARLRAALVLLAAGTPVAVVARRVGYSTPSAFIQAFRQALGVSPGAYF